LVHRHSEQKLKSLYYPATCQRALRNSRALWKPSSPEVVWMALRPSAKETPMKLVMTAALLGASMFGLATTASADVVCNGEGDCWHVRHRYNYDPGFHVTVHPDNWRWRESDRYRWREHEGRGYWRSGVWVGF
jgi:hypothetical protein